jgi:DNA-binding IclR family transcriptional regulator
MAGKRAAVAKEATAQKDRQFVTSLARGLEVLRVFRPGERHLANRDIAARANLPRPTVSRLTHTLTRLGYLVQEAETERYRLGSAVLSLGYAAVASMDFRSFARPQMQEIADFARSSCALGDCHGLEMIYVESCRGKDAPFTLGLDVGSRIPLPTTAMGRAYLAGLDETRRDELLGRLGQADRKGWPALRRGIGRAVADYEDRGFVLSINDWMPEINAVGVPVVFRDTGTVMALTCGGAASMLPRDLLEREVGPLLVAAGRQIELISRRT